MIAYIYDDYGDLWFWNGNLIRIDRLTSGYRAFTWERAIKELEYHGYISPERAERIRNGQKLELDLWDLDREDYYPGFLIVERECPFCGNKKVDLESVVERELYWIKCHRYESRPFKGGLSKLESVGCKAEGPVGYSADEVVRLWNERA